MITYIINLAADADRMAHMVRQVTSQHIEYMRVEAVDGRIMPDSEKEAFAAIRPQRAWMPGQIGCWLSHWKTWELIASGKDSYALVLEDDMHLSPGLHRLVQSTDWIPSDADIVRLEATTNAVRLTRNPSSRVDHISVHRLRSTTWCTGAYIISRQAAQKLLNTPPHEHDIADYFLFCQEDSAAARRLTTYHIKPALAVQDKYLPQPTHGFGSNIEGAQVPARVRWTRKVLQQLDMTKATKLLQGYRRIPYSEH